jgi:hypothetical protein
MIAGTIFLSVACWLRILTFMGEFESSFRI